MKLVLMAAAAASTTLLTAGMAAAQCVTVDSVVVPEIRVDPLDAAGPAELVQPLVLTFRRAGVDMNPITLRYQIIDEDSSVQSRVGLTRGPTVEWQGDGSIRDIGAFRSEAYSPLRSGSVFLGADDLSANRNVRLRLTNLRDDLPAGIYREQFTVRYWCGDADASIPHETSGAIAVTVAVPNVLSANIAGASVHGEIDFLDFATLSRNLVISVRSTGPYQVSARSLNGGVLQREHAVSPDAADIIHYEAAFDGQRLMVDGSTSRQMPRAGLAGRQIALDVTVEDVSRKRAGAYADTLLLTLAPVN